MGANFIINMSANNVMTFMGGVGIRRVTPINHFHIDDSANVLTVVTNSNTCI